MQQLPPRHVAGLPQMDRPLVMGVLNVTPDSFSDGGQFSQVEVAIEHGLTLRTAGADLIDVGGESTRPGATRPVATEELARVLPVISALTQAGACVSVDTMRAEVAAAAVAAGAQVVNDVSGGLADPAMLPTVAELGCAYIAMHWRGHSASMQQRASYDHVVQEVRDELAQRADAALAAGVRADKLCLDPGLGFAKTSAHNWELLQQLHRLDALGFPLLVGASRKSFLGTLLSDQTGPRPVDDREDATVALTTVLGLWGIWGIRVHQVRPSCDALAVVSRLQQRPAAASVPGPSEEMIRSSAHQEKAAGHDG